MVNALSYHEKLIIDPDELRELLSESIIEGVEVIANGRIHEVVLYLSKNGKKYRIAIHAIDSALGIVFEG